MLTIPLGAGALDYAPCRYGRSRTVFRGPPCDLSGPYVAMLGGSATFGKHVARPFPTLVKDALTLPVVNLGTLNGGPDVVLSDPATLHIAARARLAVVQITGAEGLSNPLYTVHSRRNDRFLAATPALRALYPQVDFTEIHFTRHLLQVLRRQDPDRFPTVVRILQGHWLTRMQELVSRLPRPVLLWLVADDPDQDPLFITPPMIDALRPLARIQPFRPSPQARAEGLTILGAEGPRAACLPGPAVHAEIAASLVPVIRASLETETGAA